MSERLPPLLWVRVFESAARHGSFLAAAKELSVSAAAVSRTIKELEKSIGVGLFVRRARGVELTDIARTYAHALAPALRQIASASAEVRTAAQQKCLRVTAMPVLAQRWLVPRLGTFKERYPDITVTVSAESIVLDPSGGEFDVALRYDEHSPADCELIELFDDALFPVVSPRLASTLKLPQDLFQLTALYDTYWESDWSIWLSARGLEAPKRWRGLYFTLYTMAVDAAVAGYGVLIGHAPFIQNELRSGELVAPFAPRVASPKRYYALVRSSCANLPAVRAFLDWLNQCTGLSVGVPRSCIDAKRYCETLDSIESVYGTAVGGDNRAYRRRRTSGVRRATR